MKPTLTPVLIEPTDVLFFRDSVPMAAGQGQGHGCRLPWPSTLHEAFRSTLLLADGDLQPSKSRTGRDGKPVASFAYQSLRTLGPLPWLERNDQKPEAPTGLFLPVPLDAQISDDDHLQPLELLKQEGGASSVKHLPCLPVSPIPASKKLRLGWWTPDQYARYLAGNTQTKLPPTPEPEFWEAEHRIGLEIEPGTSAAKSGRLYAGAYLRPRKEFRLAAWTGLMRPREDEEARLARLQFLLLGGERRLVRLSPFGKPTLPKAPVASGAGPCLLKWSLVTPAVFANGWLPGWCQDTSAQKRSAGEVCLRLPGRARIVGACLGKAAPFAGWDAVDGTPKETRLAVPAGSVYYFLCDSTAAANALIAQLHFDPNSETFGPRSDFYGEKGFGCGLCSFAVEMHRTSAPLAALAEEVFR